MISLDDAIDDAIGLYNKDRDIKDFNERNPEITPLGLSTQEINDLKYFLDILETDKD